MQVGAFASSLKRLPITSVAGKIGTAPLNPAPTVAATNNTPQRAATAAAAAAIARASGATKSVNKRSTSRTSNLNNEDSDEGALLDGQIYSFLPMPIHSGLPVHINGYFELNSSRTDVLTSKEINPESLAWNTRYTVLPLSHSFSFAPQTSTCTYKRIS